MIVYSEPDVDGNDVVTRITEADAIFWAKKIAARKNYFYADDEDALIDFMVIHWAWKED